MAKAEKVKKSKSKAETLDDMPKKKKAKESDNGGFNVRSYFDNEMDTIEKKTKISSRSIAMRGKRLSTGCLALDMYLGGGLVPGSWTTLSGGEQSCKSTTAMSIMAQVIKTKFSGIAAVHDFEGSSDANYISNMLATSGVQVDPKEVFGVPDPDGGWIIAPMIRYYAPDNGEAFFDYMSMSRRRLPDKIVEEDGTAYLLFENTKENKKIVGDKYDKKWFSKKNQFKVLAADDQMQMLVLVDSYPAMLPDQVDDDDGSKAMALQARMFSDGIKRFRGGMRRKMMTILGINQLRQRPATMFGDPAYEPCGDALKFYCFSADTKLRLSDGKIVTAPQVKEMLEKGQRVYAETAHGFQPVLKAWKVEEEKEQYKLSALGRSYVGSDSHRQLVFGSHTTSDGFETNILKWSSLRDLESNPGFAAMRFPMANEVYFDESLSMHDGMFDSFDGHVEVRLDFMHFDIPVPQTTLIVNDGYTIEDVQTRLDNYAIIHFTVEIEGTTRIVLPGLCEDDLYDALDRFDTISDDMQNTQREALYIQSHAAYFPELIAFCASTGCNMLNIGHVTNLLDKALSWELTELDEALQAEFNAAFDIIHRQLAYVEEYYEEGDNLIPVPYTVEKTAGTELWDVTVPCTGTIITNGFVSHNSDVRIRLTSRAVPQGWDKMKDRPGSVAEKSVNIEDGMDIYRFIAAKTIKNKMGGIPNQTTWLRLWESDGNGEARGFDPVFDTWHYLKSLDLVLGTRKKIKFRDPVPLGTGKSIDWDDFRTLILGSQAQIKEVCANAGLKAGNLRKWCFKHLTSDKGQQMIKDSIVKASKKGASDDDDGDDE